MTDYPGGSMNGREQDLTAAFEKTVLEYEKPVYNYAFSILEKCEDAEDAVQETFLRLWRIFCRGSEISAAYVFRTARSCAYDIARRRSRMRRTEAFSLTDAEGDEIDIADTSPDSDPREYTERRRRAARVWAAIESMSPSDREIVVLRDINGLTYSEICAVMKLNAGTVKSRLHRARERLAVLLHDEKDQ